VPLCNFLSIVTKDNIDYRPLNKSEMESYHEYFVVNSGATKVFQPSFVVLEFQRFLSTYYSNAKDHFKFNKQQGAEVDTELVIDAHNFVMSYGLTARGGEELLQLINRNISRYLHDNERLPATPHYIAIRKAFNKNLHILFKITVHNFQLPPQFFWNNVQETYTQNYSWCTFSYYEYYCGCAAASKSV